MSSTGSKTDIQKCPDCVYIEIETRSQDGAPLEDISPPVFLDIILSIAFNEQTVPVPQGAVNFGLNRGVLRFEGEGCRISAMLKHRELGRRLTQNWEQEIQELDQQIRSVSSANLQGFREDIDLYNEIRQYLPRLTNILKDMNTLTAQIHSESGFEALIKAIQHKLNE